MTNVAKLVSKNSGDEKWTDALSKIEVLKELSEQIPKTFAISLENIF